MYAIYSPLPRTCTLLPLTGVGVISGHIYAMGGLSGEEPRPTATMEAYSTMDPEAKEWSLESPMPVARYSFAVGVIENNIYAVGGIEESTNGGPQVSTNRVEVFDSNTHRWKKCAALNIQRHGCCVAVVDGFLFCLGGVSFTEVELGLVDYRLLASVEKYNPNDDSWDIVQPLSVPRWDFSVSVIGKYIYAVGGMGSGVECLSSVERYNCEKNEEAVSSMSLPRA